MQARAHVEYTVNGTVSKLEELCILWSDRCTSEIAVNWYRQHGRQTEIHRANYRGRVYEVPILVEQGYIHETVQRIETDAN